MEKIDTAEIKFCKEILKDTREDDRIYFTSGEGKEFVLISRRELNQLEKQIALGKLVADIKEAKEEADRDGWIEEEEAWKLLGIGDE